MKLRDIGQKGGLAKGEGAMLPLIGLGFFLALLIWQLARSNWTVMPNRFDKSMWCRQCGATTNHEVTAYKDEWYCQCMVCGRMTRYDVDVNGDLWEADDDNGEEESQ
jgi:hypothetical protein